MTIIANNETCLAGTACAVQVREKYPFDSQRNYRFAVSYYMI
jgi:hypothetical protein